MSTFTTFIKSRLGLGEGDNYILAGSLFTEQDSITLKIINGE